MKHKKLWWILSIVAALLAVGTFMNKWIIPGILFLAVAVFINPKFREFLEAKGLKIKKGITIAGSAVAVSAACLLAPTDKSNTATSQLTEQVIEMAAEETAEAVETEIETETQPTTEEPTTAAEKETVTEASVPVAESQPETEAPTQPETEAPTQPETEAPTQPETEAPTQPETEAPTQPATEAPTQPVTEAPTQPATEAPTQPPTEAPESTQATVNNGSSGDGPVEFTGHYYATPSGKRYHYSIECGGANSKEITKEDIERRNLTPCGNCVLK